MSIYIYHLLIRLILLNTSTNLSAINYKLSIINYKLIYHLPAIFIKHNLGKKKKKYSVRKSTIHLKKMVSHGRPTCLVHASQRHRPMSW
jgi:hypothetical protein